MTVIYGIHTVQGVLKVHSERIKCVWLQRGRQDAKVAEIQAMASAASISIRLASVEELTRLVPHEAVHQGVVLEMRGQTVQSFDDLLQTLEAKIADQAVTILALDGVQDPRNLGACLRSAAAYGVDAVILPKRRSASLTPTAEKVACGAAALVPVVAVTNLSRALSQLQQLGCWVVGTTLATDTSIADVDMTGPIVLVMGSEGEGLRSLTAKHCDYLAAIPMSGAMQSLNVSVATGICLYEQERQKQ